MITNDGELVLIQKTLLIRKNVKIEEKILFPFRKYILQQLSRKRKKWGRSGWIAIARHMIARHFLLKNNCSTQKLKTAQIGLTGFEQMTKKFTTAWHCRAVITQFLATVKYKSSIRAVGIFVLTSFFELSQFKQLNISQRK